MDCRLLVAYSFIFSIQLKRIVYDQFVGNGPCVCKTRTVDAGRFLVNIICTW